MFEIEGNDLHYFTVPCKYNGHSQMKRLYYMASSDSEVLFYLEWLPSTEMLQRVDKMDHTRYQKAIQTSWML